MKEHQTTDQLDHLLSTYLQQFKNILGVKLSLIETVCNGGSSIKDNPEFLMSKYASRSFKADWIGDPEECLVGAGDMLSVT